MLSYFNPLPHLPQYCGPHRVGTTEFEIPISEIQSSSTNPDPRISTIKFRLFYPTTQDARSKQPVYWLPEPQNQWNEAYASFMGADSGWTATMTAGVLKMWNYAELPALKDTPLLLPTSSSTHPVCIFSHGLGGNFNTYSSIVGSLASCGIVCVAPEHRDGSSPISFIKNAQGEINTSVPYQVLPHTPSIDVLNARNSQLRVRLWELELTYSVITAMNAGKTFTNYAATTNEQEQNKSKELQSMLGGRLNLQPGQVTWSGHSFGAATITQFVKSVFYHQHVPEAPTTISDDEKSVDWTPLYRCASSSELVQQVSAESPVVLLDLWTMALRGEATKWLWERPMPSYHRQPSNARSITPSTIAIISAEFYKWTDLLNRTRALLSKSPILAYEEFEKRKHKEEGEQALPVLQDEISHKSPIPQLSKQTSESSPSPPISTEPSRTPSPVPSTSSSLQPQSVNSSSTSLVPSLDDSSIAPKLPESTEPQLYLIPRSAHLSQSDFGVLFPNLTKYVMKAVEPEKTLHLNIRAILAVMRGRGLNVESLTKEEEKDTILNSADKEGAGKIDRWVRVPLVDV